MSNPLFNQQVYYLWLGEHVPAVIRAQARLFVGRAGTVDEVGQPIWVVACMQCHLLCSVTLGCSLLFVVACFFARWLAC